VVTLDEDVVAVVLEVVAEKLPLGSLCRALKGTQ
jgi:hypothetical protein